MCESLSFIFLCTPLGAKIFSASSQCRRRRIAAMALAFAAAMNHGKDAGHEKKRRERGKHQSADDGASEGSVLLAAYAEANVHGHHADDHGHGGHDDRTDAHEA